MSSFSFDEDMTEVDTFPAVFDVLAFATDSCINALVYDTDPRHEFAHFINERVNFFNRYNQIALELFDLSIVPVEDSHVSVTEVYALSKLFDMDNYLLPPLWLKETRTSKGQKREERARHSWLTIFIFSASLTREFWNMVLVEEVQQTWGDMTGGVGNKFMVSHLTCLLICPTSLRCGSLKREAYLPQR
jgi:hypothetical protein